VTVEAMRRHPLEVERSPLTAIIIPRGYLGGFRPGEWRAMRWQDVRQGTITVQESTDPGEVPAPHDQDDRPRHRPLAARAAG
jgi:integrase